MNKSKIKESNSIKKHKNADEIDKKTLATIITIIVPVVVSGITTLITASFVPLLISVGYLGVATCLIAAGIKLEELEKNNKDSNDEISDKEEVKPETPKPALFLQPKKEEKLQNTKQAANKSTNPLIKSLYNEACSTKEETMEKIMNELNIYCRSYNLPIPSITLNEWDILFSTIYKRMTMLSLQSKFYYVMNFLFQCVCVYTLLNNVDEIDIQTFVRQIGKLNSFKIADEELASIIDEINEKLAKTSKKLIYFNPKKYN